MTTNNQLFRYADLLYQKISGKIHIVDTELEKWENRSERNRKLSDSLNKITAFREKEKKYRLFDAYYNYETIHRLVMAGRRRQLVRYSAVAVSILLPLLILLMYGRPNPELPEPSLTGNDLLIPGRAVATLVLEDGSIKSLGEEDFVLTRGNTIAINQKHQLSYRADDSVNLHQAESFHTIVVPRGGEYFLELSDHSRVWLNAESMIRFPVSFQGNERKVKISGEVYMEIASDTCCPFIVETGDFDIRVLGTQFNLRVYPEEKRAMATLVKGKIEVQAPSGQSFLLHPSEQLDYNRDTRQGQVKVVDTELYTSWKDGFYILKKQTLENVLNTVSRWYGLQIFYVNPKVKDLTFTGRIKRYEHAEVFLALFERLGGVKFEISGKTVVVRKD